MIKKKLWQDLNDQQAQIVVGGMTKAQLTTKTTTTCVAALTSTTGENITSGRLAVIFI